MTGAVKAEWRKNTRRPAFLVVAGLVAGITVLTYAIDYYQALHPTAGEVAQGIAPLLKLELSPAQFVNNIIGAVFPLGAAMAIVLGALAMGSEYSWATLKTMLTQRPGRLTALAGRLIAFQAWMLVLTVLLFGLAAASSIVIALMGGLGVEWPSLIDVARGVGAAWLVLALYGTFGMALGVVFRQAAVALGAGLIYLVILQEIVTRFIGAVNGGQYQGVTRWFDGPNVQSLIESFTSTAFRPSAPPAVTPVQAATVICAYLVVCTVALAVIMKRRDVA